MGISHLELVRGWGGHSNLDMEEQEGFPEKVILGLKPADIGVNW